MANDVSPFEEKPQPEEPQEQDREWDRERYRRRRSGRHWTGPWFWGLVLIIAGVVFLLESIGINVPALQNWWALFILIPAVGAFARGWRVYLDNGHRINGLVTGSFIGGLVMTLVAATFLFGLNWTLWLPVLLILAGLGVLFTAIGVR